MTVTTLTFQTTKILKNQALKFQPHRMWWSGVDMKVKKMRPKDSPKKIL